MGIRKNLSIKANIGRALTQVRAARGVTQEDLLFAASRRHVGRIEQGHQVPSFHVIENLAESLQIHPMTLIAMAYSQEAGAQSVDQVLEAVRSDLLVLYPQDEDL
jgi:transcriptional regulator with XRE-family HTH domain